MQEKGLFVKDITGSNQSITGIFYITDPSCSKDKNGNPFWKLTLSDKTGQIQARIWYKKGDNFPESIEESSFASITGISSSFNGNLQIAIANCTPIAKEEQNTINLEDFKKPSRYNSEELYQELSNLIKKEVHYKPWRTLFHLFFFDKENLSKFKAASAAKSLHHSGSGGLLAHSLEVIKLCLAISHLFPQLDKELLILAALFHDIGKMSEMTCDFIGNTSYTIDGSLLGHTILGIQMLAPYCEKAGLPKELTRHFLHLIASHHGQYEWGAAKLPLSMEAFVLHNADNIDSKINTMSEALEGKEYESITNLPSRDAYLYKGVPTPQEPSFTEELSKTKSADEKKSGEKHKKEKSKPSLQQGLLF